MAEVYTELDTSFTTADTTSPISVAYDGRELVLSFTNHGTPLQKIVFSNVRAFSWTGWEGASPEATPDRIYRVEGSSFLAPWLLASLPFVHFKLGFNAEAMFLDVVATRMEHKNA